MTPPVSVHPADETLVSYGLGKLDETLVESVNKHLEECVPCRRRVAELSSDSFVGRLREAQPQPGAAPTRPKTIVEPDPPRPSRVAGKQVAAAVPPVPTGTLPPELVDHPQYEVLRELGRGGMGVVYLARNKLMDRLEVLKVLNREMLAKQGRADRFLREIQSAAKLHHPNVVAAYTALQIGDLLVFAMEYVEGDDLAKLVRARGPLPVVNACYFVYQAAKGLDHAHQRGTIHRDIKPGNLILFREGKQATVKILDFGLAKVTSERGVDRTLTQEGQMLGTPDYIAPEQTLDAQKADIRADIYSLGCTLYHLLTGNTPFSGNSLYEVLQAHHSVEAKSLNLVRPEVPVELAAVVAKMMAKDPNRRYQTPAEVVQALKPFLKPGGLTSPQPELSRIVSHTDRPAAAVVLPPAPDDDEPALAPMEALQPAERWQSLIDMAQFDRSSAARSAVRKRVRRQPPWMWPSVAVSVLLLGLVTAWASGVFSVKTKDGVIVLQGLPDQAEVLVDGEKVTVQLPGDGGPAEITVPLGKHYVQVKKDGFVASGNEVRLASGKKNVLTVRLEPTPTDRSTNTTDVSRVPPVPSDKPPTSGKPASEYDELANGRWVVALPSREEFERLRTEMAYRGAEPKFADGVLECNRSQLTFPAFPAQDAIVRAQVNKADSRSEKGVHVNLSLRRSGANCLVAWCNGDGWFGVGKVREGRPYEQLKDCRLQDWYNARFFEFAFAAMGNKLTVYVDGHKILEAQDDESVEDRGTIGVGARECTGLFRDIEVQVLDKPIMTPRTLPRSVERPDSNSAVVEPTANVATETSETANFVSLFNSKDLSGWKLHPANRSKWEVKDGILIGSGANGHLFTERGDYEDFHFRVEAMINDGGDSGQCFRALFFGEGRLQGKGYEAQIDSTGAKQVARTGSLMHFGTEHTVTQSLVKPNEWFTQEVIARGNRIIIMVNGEKTVEFVDDKRTFTRGHLALQVLNDATVVKFRKVEIKELSPSAPAESAAINASDQSKTPADAPGATKGKNGFVPLFNGKDQTGWRKDPNWRVENGILTGSGPGISYLFSERGDFKDFEIRIEARINDGGNSGVHFRAQLDPGNKFPPGYEAQINSTHRDRNKTGSLYIVPGGAVVSVPETAVAPGEWFKMDILAKGTELVIKVNGVESARHSDVLYTRGHVALEQHDPQTVVEFRKIEIKELPEKNRRLRPSTLASKTKKPSPASFEPIFNGTDLAGWDGDPSIWKVEDGVIVAHGENNPVNDWTGNTYLIHKGDYTDFELMLQFKLSNQGNSGVQFRTMLNDRGKVQGYQAEIGYVRGGKEITGNLYEEATGRKSLVELNDVQRRRFEAKYRGGDWNDLFVRCVGDHVVIKINGLTTVDFHDPQGRRSGFFALQSHGGMKPLIAFREIRVRDLHHRPK